MSGSDTIRILGISGSLRRSSFNSAALRAAAELAPAGMSIEIHDIGDLPLYNDDVRAAGGLRGDDGQAARHRFQVDVRKRFVNGRQDKQVSGAVKLLNSRLPPGEDDLTVNTECCGLLLILADVAVTEDEQLHRFLLLCQRG